MKTGVVDLGKPCPNGHTNCLSPKCRLLAEITHDDVMEFFAIEKAKREIAQRVRALEAKTGRPLTTVRAALRASTHPHR